MWLRRCSTGALTVNIGADNKERSKMDFKLNFHYKPGMRAIKSAFAVLLCLIAGYALKRESMFYAVIAAVICVQPTFDKSKNVGINRFIGSLIGGLIGYFSLELLLAVNKEINWLFIFINSVGVIIVIYVCNFFGVKEATTIACIVFLNLVTNFDRDSRDAFLYVLNRMTDTTIGIIFGVLVNRIDFKKKGGENGKKPENVEISRMN